MATLPHPYLTFEEYLALERQTGAKYEYYQGQVYAMSGALTLHIFIQANLGRHLGNSLDGQPCFALGSDLRVHVEASGLYTYPDVTIVCGELEFGPAQAVTNPKVIFEIHSPTTRTYDRVGKFAHYSQISTLSEYVLVEQDRYCVDRYSRGANGQWELARFEGIDAVLVLGSVNIFVPLRQIYANVPFELAEQP